MPVTARTRFAAVLHRATPLLVAPALMSLVGARPPARRAHAGRPALYVIDLQATSRAHGASGVALLQPPDQAFGMTLAPDGHVIYDVHVSAKALPAPSTLGADRYVVWATNPQLDTVVRVGTLDAALRTHGEVALNKFILLVTAEHGPQQAHWKGPLVLRGFSASTFIQNMSSDELGMGGTPPW